MKPLTLESLESRDTPAVDLGGGLLALDSGATVDVYGPSWRGGLNVAVTPDAVYVGPQAGGGPRLAKLDPVSGLRLAGDEFLGDEADRSGLKPVAVGGSVPTPEAPVSFGEGYTVFLDGADAVTTRRVAAYFAPVADVIKVTNARPDADPNSYLTVVFDAPSGWVGTPATGWATLGAVTTPGGPDLVYVSYPGRDAAPVAATVAAHEAGHAFGLEHVADPDDVMSGGPARASAAFSAAGLATIRAAAPAR